MAPLPPYHIREQSAPALLNPVRLTLSELERRLQHYLDRIPLPDDDRERISSARTAIGRVLHEIEALREE